MKEEFKMSALRMIDYKCGECGEEWEELVETVEGRGEPIPCNICGKKAIMIDEFDKMVHRDGNRYRDVSWSTWNI